VVLIRGIAFVCCTERIGDSSLAVTNILIWEAGAWRLVHHQAGAIAESAPHPMTPPTSIH
jgi:hypothetical protein